MTIKCHQGYFVLPSISRRRFLQLVSAGCGTVLFPTCLAMAGKGSSAVRNLGKRLIVGGDDSIHIFDKDSLTPLMKIGVGFLAHSFMLHPMKNNKLWSIQRYSAQENNDRFQAVEVDLEEGEVTNNIYTAPGSEFRGHGFFLPRTNILFITRVDKEKHTSYLTGYDAETGRIVQDIQIALGSCHEARYMPGQNALIATGGTKLFQLQGKMKNKPGATGFSEIYRIDLKSGKLISSSSIRDEMQSLAHFEHLADGRIIAVSKSVYAEMHQDVGPKGLGKVYVGKEGEELKPLLVPDSAKHNLRPSEWFSIAINDHNHTLIVSDYINRALFSFDLAAGDYIDRYDMDVFSLLFDAEKKKYITCSNSICAYNEAFSKPLKTFSPDAIYNGPFTGSHAAIL